MTLHGISNQGMTEKSAQVKLCLETVNLLMEKATGRFQLDCIFKLQVRVS